MTLRSLSRADGRSGGRSRELNCPWADPWAAEAGSSRRRDLICLESTYSTRSQKSEKQQQQQVRDPSRSVRFRSGPDPSMCSRAGEPLGLGRSGLAEGAGGTRELPGIAGFRKRRSKSAIFDGFVITNILRAWLKPPGRGGRARE